MSKLELRLCVIAIVFVAIYIGAIAMTIHSRGSHEDRVTRIEAAGPPPGEGHIMLAELLLPMLILLTVTVCFIVVKKKRANALPLSEESNEEFH